MITSNSSSRVRARCGRIVPDEEKGSKRNCAQVTQDHGIAITVQPCSCFASQNTEKFNCYIRSGAHKPGVNTELFR